MVAPWKVTQFHGRNDKSGSRGTLITRKARHLEAATSAWRRFEIVQMETPHPQMRIGLSPLRWGGRRLRRARGMARLCAAPFKANAVRGESPWMWTLLFRI